MDLSFLKANNITHILTIGPFDPAHEDVWLLVGGEYSRLMRLFELLLTDKVQFFLSQQQFEYKVIDIADDGDVNIIQYFEETYQFIDKAIKGSGCVLVHWYRLFLVFTPFVIFLSSSPIYTIP